VTARGGQLLAGAAPEGGAMVVMQFRINSPMGPVLTEAPAVEGLGSTPSQTDVRRAGRAFTAAHSSATLRARKRLRGTRRFRLRPAPTPLVGSSTGASMPAPDGLAADHG
jgi:hypothetical protein